MHTLVGVCPLPEEGMMLYSSLPQALRHLMVGQLEANGALKLLKLSWPDLDVEVVALVGDLEDLGPGKAVDAQAVPVH